ncbi:hypothetical protein BDN72DRAFT_554974 [Pluteus cervinus]|uniref:Uncharacterized protein n=1 Tax=Pluteus cervinus TaxID=181527 RepID=A0ACD3AWL3_9AGAR|nr:hypothetical protein BDN72DRAFT_554974 [Pluteus cervinus]
MNAEIKPAPDYPCVFPMLSTFILFSIDPVATVDGIEYNCVQRVAREMETKRYLGYVSEIHTLNTTRPWLKYDIVLIARGLPERDVENGIEPNMCLPILPNTAHPTQREPLRPTKPLPFDNCYTHSHIDPATVRARSAKWLYKEAILIPPSEAIRDESVATADLERMEELQATRGVRVDEVLKHNPDSPMTYDSRSLAEECEPQTTTLGPIDILGLVLGGGIPDDNTIAITNISYNLEECLDFAQPSDFYNEVEKLRTSVKNAKAAAIEEAKKIDEETYGGTQCRPELDIKPVVRDKVVKTSDGQNKVLEGDTSRSLYSLGLLLKYKIPLFAAWTKPKGWSRT